MNLKRDFSRRTVAVFFAVLLVVGLITGLDYSRTTDEGSEYGILKSNVTEYACQLFGEDSELAQRLSADRARISECADRDHGISAYYIFYPIGVLLHRVSAYAFSVGWHAYTFLWFMAGCCALYAIARSLLNASRKFSCAAVLMLYTTPRMFASGHYNNKDMVLLACLLMIAAFGVRWIRENRLSDGIFMALFGAVATNTRILGGWCFGAMGLAYLVHRILNHTLDKRAWRNGVIAIIVFFAAYVLLTPAMWSDPIGYFSYNVQYAKEFARYNYPILFEGKVYLTGEGERVPWYYLIKWMAMSSPVYVQLLALVGTAAAIVKSRRDCTARIVLTIALIGLLPLIYAMCSAMILYNGWRHFYFVYASVLVAAVYGLHVILNRAKKAVCVSLALAVAVNGGIIVLTHPLEDSTFNLIATPFVEEDYETDYWLLGVREVLNKIADTGEKLTVTTNFSSSVLFESALYASPERLRDAVTFTYKASEADCVIIWEMYQREETGITKEEIATSASAIGLDADDLVVPGWNDSGAFEEWFTVDVLGNTVVTVYRRAA